MRKLWVTITLLVSVCDGAIALCRFNEVSVIVELQLESNAIKRYLKVCI